MQSLKKEFSIAFKENKSGGGGSGGGQNGISILFVILIMSVILSVGLGISTILLQQFRMTGDVSESIVAFYIADSGTEIALYDFYIGPETYPDPYDEYYYYKGNLDDPVYKYEVNAWCDETTSKGETPSACPLGDDYIPDELEEVCENTENFCINSIGTYKKTKRAIEIKY